jgi:hypothetical protein
VASNLVRATNSHVLIAAGIACLLLALREAELAEAAASHYRIPLLMVTGGVVKNAILGVALVFVAVRKSRFAGATAVIVATFLIFGVALNTFASLAFAPLPVSWWNGVHLALALAILWPSLFPWSRSANKPVLFWMTLTFGLLTLLVGSLALLARL